MVTGLEKAAEHAGAEARSAPAFSWFSLRFLDPALEERFSREQLREWLPVVRLSLLLGTLLYATFGFLDFLVAGPVLPVVWIIRFLFVTPILLAILYFTWSPAFFRHSQAVLTLAMLASGCGVLGMTAVMKMPSAEFYYAGLIMVVIYCAALIRLRHTFAAASGLGLLCGYLVVASYINPVSHIALASNTFFLTMSVGLGTFSAYAIEFAVRQKFVQQEGLRRAHAVEEHLRREAQAASHAKSEFLASMSHELRTPLNAILGFSEILKLEMLGPLGSDRYLAYSEDIYNSGAHLLTIINDILDLAKAEANALELREEEVDLDALMNEALRMMRQDAARAGVQLALDSSGESLLIYADPRLLRQVVINILSNAVKFTERGGRIALSAVVGPQGNCLIICEDTGIGIAEEELSEVVKPFVQSGTAYQRRHGGTGLGLPLVKKMVELHGGSLALASRLGVGTRVTIRLPAARLLGSRPHRLARSAG